jgi:hypothetical protein
LFNKKIERNIRKKRLLMRFRRLSSNKIFITNGEYKHTNNKVIITIYNYNRQKYNYLLKIKKLYLKTFFNKQNSLLNFNQNLIRKFNLINLKSVNQLKNINNYKYYIIKTLNNNNNFSINEYIQKFQEKIIKKSLKKLQLYLYYKQLIYLNKIKFNYIFLQYLKVYLETIFSKNVEFNLINLNKFYLNSNILSEVIKLKITKNRRKLLIYLNKLKNKIKIQKITNILENNKNNNFIVCTDNILLDRFILENLKYKYVTGFRIETKGRLTKRYTASRSMSKIKYKGNILNIDSSYKGLSSVLLKGNLKSNIQYTKLKSKTRIGSFGIKN